MKVGRMRSFLAVVALGAALVLLGCRDPRVSALRGEVAIPEAPGKDAEPPSGMSPLASDDATTPPDARVPSPLTFVRGGNVYLLRPDSPEPLAMTTQGNCRTPAWSRDGRRLAYIHDLEATVEDVRGEQKPVSEVWVTDASGDSRHRVPLADRTTIAEMVWTPQGDALMVRTAHAATSDGAWRLGLDGKSHGEPVGCNRLQPCDRAESPYILEEHNYARGWGAEEVFLVGPDLKHTAYATEMTDLMPAISPHLDWAALVEPDDPDRPWTDQSDRLYLAATPRFEAPDALGKGTGRDPEESPASMKPQLPSRSLLMFESRRSLHSLAFSTDGKYLAFAAEERSVESGTSQCKLYVISVPDGAVKLIVEDAREPAWRPVQPPG
jgi:hypothetical protein